MGWMGLDLRVGGGIEHLTVLINATIHLYKIYSYTYGVFTVSYIETILRTHVFRYVVFV